MAARKYGALFVLAILCAPGHSDGLLRNEEYRMNLHGIVSVDLGTKLDCKTFLTDADAKSLSYSKVKEERHSNFWHDFSLLDKSDQVVARIQLIKSGKSGYKGGLEAMKMLKGTVKTSEETKYGEKNYVAVPGTGGIEAGKKKMMIAVKNAEVGVLKGEYYLAITVYERGSVKGEAQEKLARKLAELCSKRLP